MDDVTVLQSLIGSKSSVRILPAVYRGMDEDRRALVDFDGGRVPAYVLGGMAPMLNEPVWVQMVDGVAYMHGSTVPKPDEGTVLTAASGVANLDTDIGPVTARYLDGSTVSSGDIVRLFWGPSGPWVLGVTTESTPADVPPVGSGSGGRQTIDFSSLDSGSYQSGYGWRINEVWSSASNAGAWFYGTQITDTIPDSAVIVSAAIYLPTPIRLLGAAPFGRHGYTWKPGGDPGITATSTLPGTAGWVAIPTSLIDHLKANPGGLGFDYGGYNIWPGRQIDGDSGRLRITFDS